MAYTNSEIRDALQNTELSPVVLMVLLEELFGEDFFFWDISTIEMELRDEFQVDVPEEILNQIGAIQLLMTSDSVFKRLDGFSGICNTFASGEPAFSVFDPVTTEEAAVTIMYIAMMRDLLPVSRTVREYLGLILQQTPDSLVEYFVSIDKPDKEDILKIIKDKITNPATETDLYLADELTDMMSQAEKFPGLINKIIPTDLF